MEDYFDTQSLARYLHITPDQVQKMADRGKLPGRRIAGQWRFERADIFHWFEDRIGLSTDEELRDYQQILAKSDSGFTDASAVSMRNLVAPELVWVGCPARNKNALIVDLCRMVADTGRLWKPDEMAVAVRSREDLHPTALENGVALLHPRRSQASFFGDSFVALAITPSGLACGGPRGALTDIFFLIASGDDAFHLRLLARLSRIVNQPDVLNDLRNVNNSIAACEVLYAADDGLN